MSFAYCSKVGRLCFGIVDSFLNSDSSLTSLLVLNTLVLVSGTEISKDTGDVLAVKVDLDDNISKKSSL